MNKSNRKWWHTALHVAWIALSILTFVPAFAEKKWTGRKVYAEYYMLPNILSPVWWILFMLEVTIVFILYGINGLRDGLETLPFKELKVMRGIVYGRLPMWFMVPFLTHDPLS